MICPICGHANEDGVLFCEKCKADLEMPPVAPTAHGAPMSDAPEEPIPLEPIALEPVSPPPPPAGFEPAGAAPEPVMLEPSAPPVALPEINGGTEIEGRGPLDPTVQQPAVGRDEPAKKPKTATPPPLPSAAALVSPKLLVVRGQKMDVSYPIYGGKNYLGRTDDKPVDIDLEDQESTDRIWTSRQHAVITFEHGKLAIEDLNSLNGTFVNRTRVHPGQVRDLNENDVIQVGTVHLKVLFS
jgi:hypothetical protein